MEKILEMGKASASGSFRLFLGIAISNLVMAIGTIILARLMLEAEYGLYSIALVPSLMISLFQDWGISAAMTKYVAQYRVMNKEECIRDIITAGLMFKIVTGIVLSFLSLFFANFIATTIFNRPESTVFISVASIAIFSQALLTASLSNFVGFEKMGLNSLTMVCQAIIKSVASPLLVLLGYGVLGAVVGYTLSLLVTSIISLLMLYFVFFRNLEKNGTSRIGVSKALRMMLRFGIPLSISSIIGGFLTRFYGFMMVSFCSDVMIGNYQVAVNFAVLLTFFTFPIGTVLFPTFAKLDPEKEQQSLKTVFTSSVKFTAIFLVPATIAVMVLSEPLINTLFGEKWGYAPFFLTLYALSFLLVSFGDFSISSLLTGLGQTKMLMKLSLLTLSLGLVLAFFLVPSFGIVGVISGLIIAGIPSLFLGLYWSWKKYGVKADFDSSARILVASLVAAIATYSCLYPLNAAEWMKLVTGGTIFVTAYVVVAPRIKAITQSDINNLRAVFSDAGFISKAISIPLTLVEKTAKLGGGKGRDNKSNE